MQHEHHAGSVSGDEPERVMYPYINIRNKYAAPSSSRPMRPFLAFPRTNPSTMTNSPRPPLPRFRALPWSQTDKAILGRGSNCALFDYECGKKEKAARLAAAAAE